MDTPSPQPTPHPRLTICPYCGSRSRSLAACESCGGRFDALSRQATQNAMGPWFVRFDSQPFRPGCSYETLLGLIERGTVRPDTAIRGPTTKQFWMLARWCPGVAHRLGICHSCQGRVDPASTACAACGVEFLAATDRQRLGLGKVRALPGHNVNVAEAEVVHPAKTDVEAEPPSPVADAADASAGGAQGVEMQRLHRLQRELRRSRRWTKVWSAVVVVAVLGGSGYVIYSQLNLDAGPVGHWLSASGAGDGQDADSAQPNEADLGEIGPEGGKAGTLPDEASGKNMGSGGEPAGADEATSDIPDVEKPVRDGQAEAEIMADPRLSTLSGLRRLR
ncbi:MAG: hypothetical protein Q9O74_04845 [Planctomycetota bacterium]|nr:hypothetical protein [Planctomycetota bacterium]